MSSNAEKIVEKEQNEVAMETEVEKKVEGISLLTRNSLQSLLPVFINSKLHGLSGRNYAKVFIYRYDKKLPRGQQL